jgi:heptose I phosphotransferase
VKRRELVHAEAPLDRLWQGRDPFRWLEDCPGEVYRDLPDRRTFRFEVAGEGFFAKLHRGIGWREIAINLLSLRLPVLDARRERDALAVLRGAGVPTMETLAWGVRGRSPASRHSFIVTREIPARRTLDDLARDWGERGRCDVAVKRRLIVEVADLTRRMHDAGVNHRDLYLVHLLLTGDPGTSGSMHLIDLHRAQIRARVPRRWRVKDLGSLLFSARVAPLTRTDRLRFVAAYRRAPLRRVLATEAGLWRAVERRGERLWAEGLRKGIVRSPRTRPGSRNQEAQA